MRLCHLFDLLLQEMPVCDVFLLFLILDLKALLETGYHLL